MATIPKRTARAEHRWPVVVAILIAMALYASLPSTFLPALRYGVVIVGILLLIPVVALNPSRLTRQTKWSRFLTVSVAILLVTANQVAFIQLIIELVYAKSADGPGLLLAALQVWITNVISFALLYWELDRGGPVSRRHEPREELEPADFRFPQDEDHDAITEVAVRSSAKADWTPAYMDYLYFSASDSMAFSPTDAMPLSHRAKALMGYEAFAGFVILALVIARAVSLLG